MDTRSRQKQRRRRLIFLPSMLLILLRWLAFQLMLVRLFLSLGLLLFTRVFFLWHAPWSLSLFRYPSALSSCFPDPLIDWWFALSCFHEQFVGDSLCCRNVITLLKPSDDGLGSEEVCSVCPYLSTHPLCLHEACAVLMRAISECMKKIHGGIFMSDF